MYDDEICVEILNIIIGSCNNIDLFNKEDINGDNVLSIVVKYLKYSRIYSILIFFEGSRNIVNNVNDVGLLLLYFVVRFFNYCFLYVEFECCVRVVILILSGVDMDKKLNVVVKVIDKC